MLERKEAKLSIMILGLKNKKKKKTSRSSTVFFGKVFTIVGLGLMDIWTVKMIGLLKETVASSAQDGCDWPRHPTEIGAIM